MAEIVQQQHQQGGGQGYVESPAQKQGWRDLRSYMGSLSPKLMKGGTFTVKGFISEFILNNGGYFSQDVEKDDGTPSKWQYIKAVCTIRDERVSDVDLPLPPKNVGANFFDGWTKKGRSNLRGGMYWVHLAVTHQEPPEALVKGVGRWRTDDYEGEQHPILIRIKWEGLEQEDSQYFGRRANLRIFVDGFERDPDHAPYDPDNDLGGDDDLGEPAPRQRRAAPASEVPPDLLNDDVEPEPRPKSRARLTSGPSSPTPRQGGASSAPEPDGDDGFFDSLLASEPPKNRAVGSDPAEQRATERQMKFIHAIAREAGLDEQELANWSQELYGQEVAQLNRRDASSLIEALQRRRNEVS